MATQVLGKLSSSALSIGTELRIVKKSQNISSASINTSFTGLKKDELSLKFSTLRAHDLSVKSLSSKCSKDSKSSLIISASSKVSPKKILMMGGTRFIGVYLARLLVKDGHEVTLFTRGKSPIATQIPGETDAEFAEYSSKIKHIKGDRTDMNSLVGALRYQSFDVVYDINGREAADVDSVLKCLPNLQQYIFCSSAGVYLKSDELPHREIDAVDQKSRHKGKLDTEALLQRSNVKFTSVRPVYIYGPLNYNPVEEWFFHRLAANRPIPVPSSGIQITQLGHVKDLARAFLAMLCNEKAYGQIYNISGPKYVTFDGIAKACAKAMGVPPPTLVHFNPKDFDFGKKKAFPLRDQHFFASNEKAEKELGWTPEFDLVAGLTDSYSLDFGRGTFRKAADFTTDDMILEKLGMAVPSSSSSSSSSPAAPVSRKDEDLANIDFSKIPSFF